MCTLRSWFRGSYLLLLLMSASSLQAQSTELFPRPPELEPAINFWVRVYTEVNTESGFLHDSEYLSVVYEALPLNNKLIEETRSLIQADLRVLGSGKRDNLTGNQQRILALWPANVSNAVLSNAAANVRWQLGQSDRFLGGLERSGAYRQHINDVIREKDLPIELVVLPHVESSFNPSAYSSAAAAGMWQFTRATGQRFMRIDHIVDERMDPYIAAAAAMSLLEYNYRALGTWPLALTAYNHGTGGMARAVRETGTTDMETIVANYKGRAFGFASRNFYAQFLAVLQVENDARKHFGDVRLHPAPDFVEVRTDAYIDAEDFARSVGVSLEQLRADNPALRPAVWQGNKRIPEGFPLKLRREAVPAGNLLALVPADFKFAIQTPDVAYVVVAGDSLSVIARRFDTTVAKLVSFNQLPGSNRLSIGQRLLLPQEIPAEIPQQLAVLDPPVSVPAVPPVAIAAPAPVAATSASDDGIYTVRRGDTVSLIAKRYRVTEQALLVSSGIEDPHRIYPGQRITLPGFAAAPATPVRTTAADAPVPTLQTGDENTVTPQVAVVAEASDTTILTDDQAPEILVTEAEREAVALDPAVDVAATRERVSETLATDPSDYSVAENNSIEIQASETLGHYAEWLGLGSGDVRRLNHMAFADPVIIGERLRLDFSKVNIAEFELKRREYHSAQQQAFFSNYRIQAVAEYQIRRNDNISTVARNRYSTPIWLLRQYNPELEFDRIQIGQKIIFPLLERTQ